MSSRLAAAISLVVFAFCLVMGLGAGNTFTTTVTRALVAMAATYAVGLVIGGVAQKMLDENLKAEEQRLKNESARPPEDR